MSPSRERGGPREGDTDVTVTTDVQWDPALSTGDRRVDMQHMQLYATLIDLSVAVEAGASRLEVADAVFDLLRYAGKHFGDEEALMERIEYPRLDEQRVAHDWFADEVTRRASEYLADKDAAARPLLEFVGIWLRGHVEGEDRRLAEFIRASR